MSDIIWLLQIGYRRTIISIKAIDVIFLLDGINDCTPHNALKEKPAVVTASCLYT